MSQNETIALKTPPPDGDFDEHLPPEVKAARDLARRYRLPFVICSRPIESRLSITRYSPKCLSINGAPPIRSTEADERGCTLRWQTRPILNV